MKKTRLTFMAMILTASPLILAHQTPTPGSSSSATPAATPQAAPQGKRPPQAKTQAEFDAYQAAIANVRDAAAMDKASHDFATKFPQSDLRVLLFRGAMNSYQNANNADKMMEMGRQILALDANDPEALLGVAQVLAERTRDTDLDKDQRLDEASTMAEHAIEAIDTDISAPAATPPEKIDAYKKFLRSTAYSVIGTIQFNREKYVDAEASLRKSIAADPTQPDPVAVLRLALALDKQDKYPEALKEANQAVELTKEGTNLGTTARRERDRLAQLTGSATAPAPAVPPTAAPGSTAPNGAPSDPHKP
jgi:tetratricopeptide (TPR) repeat protein